MIQNPRFLIFSTHRGNTTAEAWPIQIQRKLKLNDDFLGGDIQVAQYSLRARTDQFTMRNFLDFTMRMCCHKHLQIHLFICSSIRSFYMVSTISRTQQFQSVNLRTSQRSPQLASKFNQPNATDIATFSYANQQSSKHSPQFGGIVKTAAKEGMDAEQRRVSNLSQDISDLQKQIEKPTAEQAPFVSFFQAQVKELEGKLATAKIDLANAKDTWKETPADE